MQPVLDTLVYLKRETSVWFEITTLLIPGLNDSDKEIHEMSEWIAKEVGVDVPLHFTAFHPDFRMLDKPDTPPSTLGAPARSLYQKDYVTSTSGTSTIPTAPALTATTAGNC